MKITLTTIMRAVQHETGVTREEMADENRRPIVVLARTIFCGLAREYTTHSYIDIGRWFGTCHSTPISCADRCRTLSSDERKIMDRIRARMDGVAATEQAPHGAVTHRRLTLAEICRAVSDYYGVSVEQMMSRARHRHITIARSVAMQLCCTLTTHSCISIGEYFHRDHTTVLAARNKVRNDPSVREDRDKVAALLGVQSRVESRGAA